MQVVEHDGNRIVVRVEEPNDVWEYVAYENDQGYTLHSETLNDAGETFEYTGKDLNEAIKAAMKYEKEKWSSEE